MVESAARSRPLRPVLNPATARLQRRALYLAALSVLVFLVAAGIEWRSGRRTSPADLAWAAVFLPVTAVVGARTAFGLHASAALLLGIAFWPVWLFLSGRWLRQGPECSTGFALAVWMLLGFAQPVARWGVLMSA